MRTLSQIRHQQSNICQVMVLTMEAPSPGSSQISIPLQYRLHGRTFPPLLLRQSDKENIFRRHEMDQLVGYLFFSRSECGIFNIGGSKKYFAEMYHWLAVFCFILETIHNFLGLAFQTKMKQPGRQAIISTPALINPLNQIDTLYGPQLVL